MNNLNKEICERAEQMARSGEPISRIAQELKVDYDAIKDYLYSRRAYAWIGAKRIITIRLKSLINENDKAKRKVLADEAREMIDYLYYEGTELSKKVLRTKKILDLA